MYSVGIYMRIFIYRYTYIYTYTHTHTHTHTYIYIYIYITVRLCICVCIYSLKTNLIYSLLLSAFNKQRNTCRGITSLTLKCGHPEYYIKLRYVGKFWKYRLFHHRHYYQVNSDLMLRSHPGAK